MRTKLPPSKASAYEALDRLLLREWDPIGVRDCDGADAQYQAYLPEFWRLVTLASPDEDIVGYLSETEEYIGVGTSGERKADIAKKAKALLAAWALPVRP